MKIAYIGQLWLGGTCLERKRTITQLGHEVVEFDTTHWTNLGNRLVRSIAHRLNHGTPVIGLNRALEAFAKSLGHADAIWIDKGKWIYPSTLSAIKRATDGYLVHYSPDAHFYDNQSRHFDESIPDYDLIVTTKHYETDLYRARGAQRIVTTIQGYDPRFAAYSGRPEDCKNWGSDVCFVGHQQPHYAQRLKVVANSVDCLKIWGPNWPQYASKNAWATKAVQSKGVWGEDYLRALAHAKIGLGLLGKHVPETSTTRTFEIPAIGTFLLAERTDEHLSLFSEGEEAEFFSSDIELREKIDFYLSRDNLRERIAAAGRMRCIRSGYSGRERLQHVLKEIERDIEFRKAIHIPPLTTP